jgi:hypothetical protein
MKWNNIFHALGALGCISGVFGLYSYGWPVWQWPVIAFIWIVCSYINVWHVHRVHKDNEELRKDLINSIERLAKADTRAWEAEMKLANANKK